MGDVDRAMALLRSVIEEASTSGDELLELHARLEEAARLPPDDEHLEVVKRFAEASASASEARGDDLGVARALRRLAWVHRLRCQNRVGESFSERALEHARRARDVREEARIVDGLCTALVDGPARVDEAIGRCETLLTQADGPLAEANVRIALGALTAMRGSFEDARALYRRSKATYEELGLRFAVAGATQIGGDIELLAGDPAAAERELREGYEILAGVAGTVHAAMLARVLEIQGRGQEAEELLGVAAASRAPTLTATDVTTRAVSARIAVQGRRHEDAVRIAREAVKIAGATDALNLQGTALRDLAHVLELGGDQPGAQQALDEALDRFRLKGNVAATVLVERGTRAEYRRPVEQGGSRWI
jgi:tetratricopeptide (TPR) repeat protein